MLAGGALRSSPLLPFRSAPLPSQARGLDIVPQTIQRFRAGGDDATADLLESVIYPEEVTHCAAGVRWFTYLCVRDSASGRCGTPAQSQANGQAGGNSAKLRHNSSTTTAALAANLQPTLPGTDLRRPTLVPENQANGHADGVLLHSGEAGSLSKEKWARSESGAVGSVLSGGSTQSPGLHPDPGHAAGAQATGSPPAEVLHALDTSDVAHPLARCLDKHLAHCPVKEDSGLENGEGPGKDRGCRCFLCRVGLGGAAVEGILGSMQHQAGEEKSAPAGREVRGKGVKDAGVVDEDGGGDGRLELEGMVVERFHGVVRKHFRGRLKRPFNEEAREKAGFSKQWYEPLAD